MAMNQRVGWWLCARGLSIGLTFIALLLLCSLSACADAGGTQISDNPPLSAPTVAPKGGTVPQSAVVLGGSMLAFNNKFQPIAQLDDGFGWTYRGPYGGLHTTAFAGDTGPDYDEVSTHRVFGIDNSRFDAPWTVTQAKTFCTSFIPADAKLTGATNLSFGKSLAQGFVQYYSSVSLANTLPPKDFVDAKGKALTPGTFFIYYNYPYNRPNNRVVDGCVLGTDESYMDALPV